jgi:predicted phosphodiesterase
MRLWIISDLHIDHHDDLDLGPHPDVDYIVMAGDISDGDYDPVPWMLSEFSADELSRLIFVPGNHELYGIGIDAGEAHVARLQRETGITVLQRDTIELGGYRFVGCTMWTPLSDHLDGLGGDLVNIPNFSGDAWRALHEQDRAWLEETVREGDIVITHHSPDWEGLAADMQHNVRLMSLASGYLARMGPLIEERRPALWVHGHTHVTREYEVGSTRVVSNALGRGYNHRFEPGYVVEIEEYRPKPPGF